MALSHDGPLIYYSYLNTLNMDASDFQKPILFIMF